MRCHRCTGVPRQPRHGDRDGPCPDLVGGAIRASTPRNRPMTATTLTDTRRAILTAAYKRKDRRVFPIAVPGLKGGAVTAVLKSLLKNGLVEETPASGDDHVWRKGDGDVTLTL